MYADDVVGTGWMRCHGIELVKGKGKDVDKLKLAQLASLRGEERKSPVKTEQERIT